jgi:2-oxo-4-hydroxy-4-carboxy-5-ureidoimidazoline decarboxylase
VGARSAQAIAKVCLAALARVEEGVVRDIRIALGSVAPTPIRLPGVEGILEGNRLDRERALRAQREAVNEIRPITDLRSTAAYRARVVSNLVGDFLERLDREAERPPARLPRWNQLSLQEAAGEILACCGSRAWAQRVAARRPIHTAEALLSASDEVWSGLDEADWIEAFRGHPRIGERPSEHASESNPGDRANQWSAEEQSRVSADERATEALAEANRVYEERFGHIFIVCAEGKSAADILEILERRLKNDGAAELREAAEQQRQITHLRLKKWLLE